jgi:Family of unknown function (DUF6174)
MRMLCSIQSSRSPWKCTPRIRRLIPVLVLAAVSGCDGPERAVSPRELTQLARAEAKWAAKGFANYSFERIASCGNCPNRATQLARVDVVDGVVVRVVMVLSGEVVPVAELGGWTTVESTFAWIRRVNMEEGIERLDVTFDDRLGFPTFVAWFYRPTYADPGAALTLRSVVPLAN